MILEALVAATLVALIALVGALFFGSQQRLLSLQRHVVPVAVGVFLSLVLFELIPATLSASPEYGGIAVAFGFIGFYVLANVLHNLHHQRDDDECERRGAALLLLIGDFVHNTADGVILGGAFLVDSRVGVATAVGLALHEIPQEIIEFGVLVRAGFSRKKAALYNLLSASGIILGTLFTMLVASSGEEYIWLLTGTVAGNLLFLAASDLLPRIHSNLDHYGGLGKTTTSLTLGFLIMTGVLMWTHEHIGRGHNDEEIKSLLDGHTVPSNSDHG